MDDKYDISNSSSSLVECQTIQEILPDAVDSIGFKITIGALYTIVWLLGVWGNALVVYVAVLKHVSFTVRTVFIVSLAISDLIICFSALPVTVVSTYTRSWILPDFFCYSIGSIQGWGIFISSFTLTAVAVDRYFLIVHPTRVSITYRQAVMVLGCIWITGYLLALPLALFMDVVSYEGICDKFCTEKWPGAANDSLETPPARKVYGTTVMALQFGLPICLCSYCYYWISRTLTNQIHRRQESQVMLKDAEQRLLRRRNRANRMMASMVIMFAVTWAPLNFVNNIRDFNLYSYLLPDTAYSVVFSVCHCIAMTSVIVNPIVYSFYNEMFRKAVLQLVPPVCRRHLSSENAAGSQLVIEDQGTVALQERIRQQRQSYSQQRKSDANLLSESRC